jgi:hypothetical protein
MPNRVHGWVETVKRAATLSHQYGLCIQATTTHIGHIHHPPLLAREFRELPIAPNDRSLSLTLSQTSFGAGSFRHGGTVAPRTALVVR